MSERGGGKSRKSPAPKALTSKPAAAKAAAPKKSAKASRKSSGAAPRKTKTQPKRAASGAAATLDAPSLMARVVRLESERDRLQAELEKAEARIRALEEGRDQVLNRIDWVIDSLRNLIEDEA